MSKKYAILGIFDTTPAVYEAAKKVRDAGYQNWDVISSFPIHGIEKAMGLKRSKVPVFSLCGGIIGFITGLMTAWFMGAVDYPLIVGGKPYFSPIFPFPVAYELTILLAAFGTLGGMFITNRLPMHHHPLFDYERFPELMDDKFAVVIEAKDPNYDRAKTADLLKELGASEITEIEENS